MISQQILRKYAAFVSMLSHFNDSIHVDLHCGGDGEIGIRDSIEEPRKPFRNPILLLKSRVVILYMDLRRISGIRKQTTINNFNMHSNKHVIMPTTVYLLQSSSVDLHCGGDHERGIRDSTKGSRKPFRNPIQDSKTKSSILYVDLE